MDNVYGVTTRDGEHIDTSNTLLGAKQYATRHGYTKVSTRWNCGYVATITCEKVGKAWVDV